METIWMTFVWITFALRSLWIMSPAGIFGDSSILRWCRHSSSKRSCAASGYALNTNNERPR